jgi:hypothetical protein
VRLSVCGLTLTDEGGREFGSCGTVGTDASENCRRALGRVRNKDEVQVVNFVDVDFWSAIKMWVGRLCLDFVP